jgi:hypothetical protein
MGGVGRDWSPDETKTPLVESIKQERREAARQTSGAA